MMFKKIRRTQILQNIKIKPFLLKITFLSFNIKRLNWIIYKLKKNFLIYRWHYKIQSLPMKNKHITVLRGPHVDKKSREQYKQVTHQYSIEFLSKNKKNLNTRLFVFYWLRKHISSEVELNFKWTWL